MSFRSRSQQRYMFSQHPEIASRWAKEMQKGSMAKLPEKAKPSNIWKHVKPKGGY